jgi:hypothetical protein
LDVAMKRLSWRPPWCRPCVGQQTVDDDFGEVFRLRFMGRGKILADEIVLNRSDCLWCKLNGKYYLLQDVLRFGASAYAVSSVTMKSDLQAAAPVIDDVDHDLACCCRYAFRDELVDRDLGFTCKVGRGQNGEWTARFSRQDFLSCSHEPFILMATLGDIDWPPLIHMHMVIEYLSKYATKAPDSSKKWQDNVQVETQDIWEYVVAGDQGFFLRMVLQKFYAKFLVPGTTTFSKEYLLFLENIYDFVFHRSLHNLISFHSI